MNEIKASDRFDLDRRRFFGAAALAIATAELGLIGSARAQAGKPQLACDQTGDEHVLRAAQANRCRRSQCRICRGRPRRRSRGHSSARLALRHLQLRRRDAVVGVGRIPGDRALSAWLRHDAVPFRATRSVTGSRRPSPLTSSP